MRVVATAGHVDHGKSTLVRALTGTDPDRWAEEHARGLTIDLGYASLVLPGGEQLAFVDVPGHQRFITNMLAGLGPAPAVLFVVAADEGWRRQSTEHLAAVRALGLDSVLLAVTRSDLADPAPALAEASARLVDAGLPAAGAVAVSGVTGQGLDDLRTALARLVAGLPAPVTTGRARLWVDRAFTIRGAGTVVTGTLESGTLSVGDEVRVGERTCSVRGVQLLGEPAPRAQAVARVALNLRGLPVEAVERGDAVLAHGPWRLTTSIDGQLPDAPDDLPRHATAHVGTAAFPVRLRPLAERGVRLTWEEPLPLQPGDRIVLRAPGQHRILGGVLVVAADPPALRRGEARPRGRAVSEASGRLDPTAEVTRRGWMTAAALAALGGDPDAVTDGVRRHGGLLVSPDQWRQWADALGPAVDAFAVAHPLQGRMPTEAAATALGLPQPTLVAPLAADAGLTVADGHVSRPGARADFGPHEAALTRLEARLAERPLSAPERDELTALGLGPREVAAAVRHDRLLDLGDLVVVAPTAPARAMRTLAGLPQPFTTSQARQALGTTRRVVIPLLEHLDARGWTRRLDGTLREVVRR